jgi:hypothetical protein
MPLPVTKRFVWISPKKFPQRNLRSAEVFVQRLGGALGNHAILHHADANFNPGNRGVGIRSR